MTNDAIMLTSGQMVALRRSARARRMVLRVSRADGAATLTLPPRASVADARAFVLSREEWLRRTAAAMPGPAVVAFGAALPVAGVPLVLTPAPVRVCRIEGEALLMPQSRPPGPVAAAWLAQRARAALMPLCAGLAARLTPGATPLAAVTLRDTRSRWGSCTAQGRLMFSWRLAMAPPGVLAYVAAHEVAHLAHLDHSPRFWAAVEALHPNHAPERAWLKRHGPGLQSWRFRSDPASDD